MFATSFVLGYHGCDKEIGERILRSDHHVGISSNRYDWLGAGAYFWENSPERARTWADFLTKHPPEPQRRISEPFVIGAIIDRIQMRIAEFGMRNRQCLTRASVILEFSSSPAQTGIRLIE